MTRSGTRRKPYKDRRAKGAGRENGGENQKLVRPSEKGKIRAESGGRGTRPVEMMENSRWCRRDARVYHPLPANNGERQLCMSREKSE